MATKQVSAPAPAPANRPPYMLIEEIRVQGYKSLVDATLHVRPLTLLAGTNSSGKSSIMQPLLLIKQTMEAPYQPAGALVLDGAHVQAETAGELVSSISNTLRQIQTTFVGVVNYSDGNQKVTIEMNYEQFKAIFLLKSQKLSTDSTKKYETLIEPDMTWLDFLKQMEVNAPGSSILLKNGSGSIIQDGSGFLKVLVNNEKGELTNVLGGSGPLEHTLARIMHIPGLRRKPERSYFSTSFDDRIKGAFDLYAAGTVSQWQEQKNTEALAQLNGYLRRLGLTDSVTAKVKNANEVELSVSRLPAGSKGKPRKADMVNIADVGIGVSQVLPILVALIAAQEGQIVYVEQPELHLHPRAQVAMAELLAEAANRGVRVIVETHSSLLLLTVQTLIAQDRIKNTDVALHWFARDAKGATTVNYVQPDEDGAYGEWPEDFGDVELKAQDAYLTAVGLRHFDNAGK